MKINFGKIKTSDSYKLIKNIKYKNKVYKDLAKDYDSFGYLPYDIGKNFEENLDFDNYKIGIHATGYSNFDEEGIEKVFKEGLINNGDRMLGINSNYIDTEKTVTFLSNFTLFVGRLKSVNNYKNSKGAFIIKIPKEYINNEKEDIKNKPIYKEDNGIYRLLGEYIYGHISIDQKGNITDFKKNKNYTDIHSYDNEELLYDGEIIKENKSYR